MNRIFLSLYVVIVLSVVVVGQGANKLWQLYNPEPEVSEYEKLFFTLLDKEFGGLNQQELAQKVDKVSAQINQNLSLYTIDELARSSMSDRIGQGYIVTVFDQNGLKSSYKRIQNSDYIVRLQLVSEYDEQDKSYMLLLIAFYASIAIIIYFWIWPLSRDLKKLSDYTKKVGLEAPGKVNLGHRSAVYTLAAAFNTMAERIHDLLSSHKEMTYAVSHELRTPLARMKFALEMANDSESLNLVRKQLSSVREDVDEMDTLINELLAYAVFEQRNQPLTFSEGDLPSLLEDVMSSHQAAQGRPEVHFSIDNRMVDGAPVKCEWYLLERCMHNLIQNAFRYARSSVVVTLDKVNHHYLVVVEDDGPGIAEDDRQKIFKAFVRLRKVSDENKSGFGLGLAIVSRIMKWHRGQVSVESTSQGGARFILTWPVPSTVSEDT